MDTRNLDFVETADSAERFPVCIEDNNSITPLQSASTHTITDLYRSPSWRWEAAMREKDNSGGLGDRHDPDLRLMIRAIQRDGFEAFVARRDEFSRLFF